MVGGGPVKPQPLSLRSDLPLTTGEGTVWVVSVGGVAVLL
jgi:hypothetical protein